ncbi:MAG TPA: glycine cleavage T C-terminal barrel domain-containing protein, partial [Acidimicrobiales bacterium]|nr:glycine cleavage T C-terminal barrel domain-containing protein [Acidimicrobiales bacterium]
DQGLPRLLRGLSVPGRRPPRADQVVRVGGEDAGVVTSGNFSPMLGHGIALAFLPPDVEEGAEVAIVGKGDPAPATVVPTPFVSRPAARPSPPSPGGATAPPS